MAPRGSLGDTIPVCVSDSPSSFFDGSPYSTGPPVWQGQVPNASPWLALSGIGRTEARLLRFGTVTHLKEVVLAFLPRHHLAFCRKSHIGGSVSMDS